MPLLDNIKQYLGLEDPTENLLNQWRNYPNPSQLSITPVEDYTPPNFPLNYTPHLGYDRMDNIPQRVQPARMKEEKKKKRKFSTA